MRTTETCRCGWRVDQLQDLQHQIEASVEQIRAYSGPFKAQMLEGEQKRLATIKGHLSEPRRTVDLPMRLDGKMRAI